MPESVIVNRLVIGYSRSKLIIKKSTTKAKPLEKKIDVGMSLTSAQRIEVSYMQDGIQTWKPVQSEKPHPNFGTTVTCGIVWVWFSVLHQLYASTSTCVTFSYSLYISEYSILICMPPCCGALYTNE